MVAISVRADVSKAVAGLGALASKQIPFATAMALNDVAFQVQKAETAAIAKTFKSPRPFTAKSVQVNRATKSNPVAAVFIRPEVAKYLDPYEFGGLHVLPGKALLNPVNAKLDQYGQMPRYAVQRLLAMPNVFAGPVTFKNGQTVSGIWQRSVVGKRKGGGRGTKGALNRVGGALTSLKLLVRFGNALPVTKHLGFVDRGIVLVGKLIQPAMHTALVKALASAR
jgi:hypothetical protein